jgi:hypothetical protein
MIKSRKLLTSFLFITVACSIIVKFAEATTMNITVQSGQDETRSISVAVDDHVLIKFTVVGLTDSSLHFSITYPNGTTKDFGRRGNFHDSFVCDTEGECVLRFSNTDSIEDKLVTLDYEVQHYIFGIPQMLFLTIIIVVICVAAVAVFIFMGKPR